jgi:hypothetical protein
MRAPKMAMAAAVLGLGAALGPPDVVTPELFGQGQVELPVRPVPMGDYEVVPNWPRPLPDRDLSHDGWTWGSGAGVLVENPNKVWVAQRSEI